MKNQMFSIQETLNLFFSFSDILDFEKRYLENSLVPRRFGLFTSLSARGTAREGEKWKIRREAPGKIRIQNGGSVFCKCSVLFILLLK